MFEFWNFFIFLYLGQAFSASSQSPKGKGTVKSASKAGSGSSSLVSHPRDGWTYVVRGSSDEFFPVGSAPSLEQWNIIWDPYKISVSEFGIFRDNILVPNRAGMPNERAITFQIISEPVLEAIKSFITNTMKNSNELFSIFYGITFQRLSDDRVFVKVYFQHTRSNALEFTKNLFNLENRKHGLIVSESPKLIFEHSLQNLYKTSKWSLYMESRTNQEPTFLTKFANVTQAAIGLRVYLHTSLALPDARLLLRFGDMRVERRHYHLTYKIKKEAIHDLCFMLVKNISSDPEIFSPELQKMTALSIHASEQEYGIVTLYFPEVISKVKDFSPKLQQFISSILHIPTLNSLFFTKTEEFQMFGTSANLQQWNFTNLYSGKLSRSNLSGSSQDHFKQIFQEMWKSSIINRIGNIISMNQPIPKINMDVPASILTIDFTNVTLSQFCWRLWMDVIPQTKFKWTHWISGYTFQTLSQGTFRFTVTIRCPYVNHPTIKRDLEEIRRGFYVFMLYSNAVVLEHNPANSKQIGSFGGVPHMKCADGEIFNDPIPLDEPDDANLIEIVTSDGDKFAVVQAEQMNSYKEVKSEAKPSKKKPKGEKACRAACKTDDVSLSSLSSSSETPKSDSLIPKQNESESANSTAALPKNLKEQNSLAQCPESVAQDKKITDRSKQKLKISKKATEAGKAKSRRLTKIEFEDEDEDEDEDSTDKGELTEEKDNLSKGLEGKKTEIISKSLTTTTPKATSKPSPSVRGMSSAPSKIESLVQVAAVKSNETTGKLTIQPSLHSSIDPAPVKLDDHTPTTGHEQNDSSWIVVGQKMPRIKSAQVTAKSQNFQSQPKVKKAGPETKRPTGQKPFNPRPGVQPSNQHVNTAKPSPNVSNSQRVRKAADMQSQKTNQPLVTEILVKKVGPQIPTKPTDTTSGPKPPCRWATTPVASLPYVKPVESMPDALMSQIPVLSTIPFAKKQESPEKEPPLIISEHGIPPSSDINVAEQVSAIIDRSLFSSQLNVIAEPQKALAEQYPVKLKDKLRTDLEPLKEKEVDSLNCSVAPLSPTNCNSQTRMDASIPQDKDIIEDTANRSDIEVSSNPPANTLALSEKGLARYNYTIENLASSQFQTPFPLVKNPRPSFTSNGPSSADHSSKLRFNLDDLSSSDDDSDDDEIFVTTQMYELEELELYQKMSWNFPEYIAKVYEQTNRWLLFWKKNSVVQNFHFLSEFESPNYWKSLDLLPLRRHSSLWLWRSILPLANEKNELVLGAGRVKIFFSGGSRPLSEALNWSLLFGNLLLKPIFKNIIGSILCCERNFHSKSALVIPSLWSIEFWYDNSFDMTNYSTLLELLRQLLDDMKFKDAKVFNETYEML